MVDQSGCDGQLLLQRPGQLSGLTDGSGHSIVAYTYDATGSLSQETKGNGTYTKYTYDAAGDTLSIVNYAPGGAINSSFDYAYNDLGPQTAETTLDGQWAYTYDAIGQLTQAVFVSNNPGATRQPGPAIFLRRGRQPHQTIINGVTTTYTTNDRNEYTQVGSTSYTYDANGNMVSQADGSGTTAYTYNVNNQLLGIQPASGSASSYQYDPVGNRVFHDSKRPGDAVPRRPLRAGQRRRRL